MNRNWWATLSMLRLDLLGLRPTVTSMLILFTLAALFSFGADNPVAGLPMIGVGFAIFPVSLFAADDMHQLQMLYGSLPLRRRDVINSRYLLNAIFLLAAVLVMFGLVLLTNSDEALMWLAPIWAGVALSVLPSIQIPAALRFGSRKAMWVMIAPFALVMAAGTVITTYGDPEVMFAPLIRFATASPVLLTLAALVVTAIGAVISWQLSQRIYARQDH